MTVGPATAVRSELSIDDEFHRTYSSIFKVESDVKDESPKTVINASGIPTFRASHYQWPPGETVGQDLWAFAARARAFNPDRNSQKLWHVEVIHETIRATSADRPATTDRENPVDEPARWSGSFMTYDKHRRQDRNGNDLLFSNGLPMRDVVYEEFRESLQLELNTDTIDLQQRRAMTGGVNNATFWGFDQEIIKLAGWQFQVGYYGASNTPYVAHVFTFQFDEEDGWAPLVEHRHTMEKFNSSGSVPPHERWAPIMVAYQDPFDPANNSFAPTTEPLPLDSNGLAVDDPTSVYKARLALAKLVDFTTLPIPQTLPDPPFHTPP